MAAFLAQSGVMLSCLAHAYMLAMIVKDTDMLHPSHTLTYIWFPVQIMLVHKW